MKKIGYFLAFLFLFCSLTFAQTDTISEISFSTKEYVLTSKEVALRMENCKEIDVSHLDDCTFEKTIQILVKYLQYPPIAREMGLEGSVYVQFVVDETGSVGKWEIMRSSSTYFEVEVKKAFQLAQKQLKFIPPTTKDGEKVKVAYTLPVKFKLN